MNTKDKDSYTAAGRLRRLGLRHAIGRDWYLFKVELYLDGKVPGRRRKGILAELRDNIDAEARDSSLKTALQGLGKPSELAASYSESTHRPQPQWGAGATAALAMLMVYWLFLFTYSLGMTSVAHQVGGEFHSSFFMVHVMAFSGEDGIGIGWEGKAALWFPVILAAAAFIAASRFWRIFGRRN